MSSVSPFQVLSQVADAVPSHCHENIVIIGSLAAGFHFFGQDKNKAVRTKDVDVVLEPFHAAVGTGQNLAIKLLAAGWKQQSKNAQTPGNAETPVDQLPVVRLYPPGAQEDSEQAWFLELLTVPKSSEVKGKEWTRLALPQGHFGLPTFRFLSLTAHNALPVGELGIRYAQPMNMALANLLEHPSIKPAQMSSLFAERLIKRSNKDLGRVLAITILADLDDYSAWADAWRSALLDCFPETWASIAEKTGAGLRALLNSNADLEEALHTCANGLLSSQSPTIEQLKTAGERLLGDAIERLESAAESGRNLNLPKVRVAMSVGVNPKVAVEKQMAKPKNQKPEQDPLQIINKWLSTDERTRTSIVQLHEDFIETAIQPILMALGINTNEAIITVRSSFCEKKDYIRPVYSAPRSLTPFLRKKQKPFDLPQAGAFDDISWCSEGVNTDLKPETVFAAWHKTKTSNRKKSKNQARTINQRRFVERIDGFISDLCDLESDPNQDPVLSERAKNVNAVFFAGRTRSGDAQSVKIAHLLAVYYPSKQTKLSKNVSTSNLEDYGKRLFEGLDLIAKIDSKLFESDGFALVAELLPEFSRDDVALADKIAFSIERMTTLLESHMIGRHGGGETATQSTDSVKQSVQGAKIFYLATSFKKTSTVGQEATVVPRLRVYPQCYSTEPDYIQVAYFVAHKEIPTATEFLLWKYLSSKEGAVVATTSGSLHKHHSDEVEHVTLSKEFSIRYQSIGDPAILKQLFPESDCLVLANASPEADLWNLLQRPTSADVKSIAAFVVEGKRVHGDSFVPRGTSKTAIDATSRREETHYYLPRGIFAIESSFEDGFSDRDIESLRKIFSGIAALIRSVSHHHSPIDYRSSIHTTFEEDYRLEWSESASYTNVADAKDELSESLPYRLQRLLFYTQKLDANALSSLLDAASRNYELFRISKEAADRLREILRRDNWLTTNLRPLPRERSRILSLRMQYLLDYLQILFDGSREGSVEPDRATLIGLLNDETLDFLEAIPENFTWSSYLMCLSQTLGDRISPYADGPEFSRMMPGFSATGMFIARVHGELRQVVKLSSAERVDREADNYRKWVRYRLVNAAKIPNGAFDFETSGWKGRESGILREKSMAFDFRHVEEDADGILVSDLVSGGLSPNVRTLLDVVTAHLFPRMADSAEGLSDIPSLQLIFSKIQTVFYEHAVLWRSPAYQPGQQVNVPSAKKVSNSFRLEKRADVEEANDCLKQFCDLVKTRSAFEFLKEIVEARQDWPSVLSKVRQPGGGNEALLQSVGIIHGDLNARNLTWSKGLDTFFLIDFEHTGNGLRGADQIRLCVNLAVEAITGCISVFEEALSNDDLIMLVKLTDEGIKFLAAVFQSLLENSIHTFSHAIGVNGAEYSIESVAGLTESNALIGVFRRILGTVVLYEPGGKEKSMKLHWARMLLSAAMKECVYAMRGLQERDLRLLDKIDWLFDDSIIIEDHENLSNIRLIKLVEGRAGLLRFSSAARLLFFFLKAMSTRDKAQVDGK